MEEKSKKVEEHYEIPLPLIDRSVKLLNNRNMTEKKFHCLSRDLSEAQNFLKIVKDS